MRHLHYDTERMLGYATTDYATLTALVEDDLDCLSLEALLAEQELEELLAGGPDE